MFDWLYLMLLLFVALTIILLAVKKKNVLVVVLPLLFSLFVVGLYGKWGSWFSWRQFQDNQHKTERLKAVLKQFKSPELLIQKLQQQLDETPGSARGWYLLGRLYSSQNHWAEARDAFKKAIQFAPHQQRYQMNYVYALWELNNHKFDLEIRQSLQTLLQKNAKQPDALAMLAMDAYQQKRYQQAITYWQVLLTLAPSDSDAAMALRKAIAKAQRKLLRP